MSKIALEGNASGTGTFTIASPNSNNNQTLTLPDNTGTILTTGTAVTVAQGGTGATSLTANNVLLGNGTSAVQVVAPGTNGNVLTSNGTTWTSAAAPTASTALDGIGSYAVLMMGVSTNLAIGSTIAGSSLRYNFTPNSANSTLGASANSAPFLGRRIRSNNSTYDGGGTALSGTWRKMSSGVTFVSVAGCGNTDYCWWEALYVRIS
jgi:hypothetical protein